MRTSMAYSCLLVLTVYLSLSIDSTSAASFPKTWKRCKQTDPELNKCLSVAIIDAVKKMETKGNPALGVFPIDPLVVSKMDVLKGNSGPVSLELAFNDLKILGMAKSSIIDVKAKLKIYEIYAKTLTPAFTLVGDYSMNGRVLLLPIQGKGRCNITLHELVTEHFLTGEVLKKDGKEYMKLKSYRLIFKPKIIVSHFGNLFNGDKALGDTMNRFMNDNWEAIFVEILPSLQITFGALFKEISNRIFTKLPFNQIFLP